MSDGSANMSYISCSRSLLEVTFQNMMVLLPGLSGFSLTDISKTVSLITELFAILSEYLIVTKPYVDISLTSIFKGFDLAY